MLKRPLLIIVCSGLFLYFPFELGWRVAGGSPWTVSDIVLNLVFPAVLLFGLIRVTRTGWFVLIAMISMWGIRDLSLFYRERHSSPSALWVHIFIYAISLAYFINPRVRRLYFDPRLRWWRTKPRYETHLPLMVTREKSAEYRVLRNISEGGCFIESDAPFSLNTVFDIDLPLPIPLNVSVFSVKGEVRWVSTGQGMTGMGVQFVGDDRIQKRTLKAFVKEQL